MIVWGMVLFGLAVLALFDSLYNYGQLFRSISPILFMLTSLGLLLRARVIGGQEKRLKDIEECKAQLERLLPTQSETGKKESRQDVTT